MERAGCGLKASLQQQKLRGLSELSHAQRISISRLWELVLAYGLLSWVGPRAPFYLLYTVCLGSKRTKISPGA